MSEAQLLCESAVGGCTGALARLSLGGLWIGHGHQSLAQGLIYKPVTALSTGGHSVLVITVGDFKGWRLLVPIRRQLLLLVYQA